MRHAQRLVAMVVVVVLAGVLTAQAGVPTANGWYEEEEIYYILRGIEEGVTERGINQIYFVGGDRLHQSNVVLHIPGESGYSPHWNVNIVHSSPGVVVQDIVDAGFASDSFSVDGVLFDDARDIMQAALPDTDGNSLVYIEKPGVVVLCPIVSEEGAEAPGNQLLPEDQFFILGPGDVF